MPVMISRSGRCPWRTRRRRPASVLRSACRCRKSPTSASTACVSRARAPLRKISVSESVKVPGCASLKTLVSTMAYHSFGGEVEALNTPTIRRLTPSCRHQLSRIALAEVLQFKEANGAIIANVAENSPAAEAGLEIGEIVVGIEGKRVIDYRTLDQTVARSTGENIPLRVWSGGKFRVVTVSVREFPDSPWVSYQNDKAGPGVVFSKITDDGFEVADLTDDLRAQFHLKTHTTGPVVTVVADNTAAKQAGLRPGDVIKKVQMEDVRSRTELEQRLQQLQQQGQRNALLYVGGVDDARWLTIPLRL